MLLPQSSAFAALKNRLNSVSAIGYLHIAPRTYVSSISLYHTRQKSSEIRLSSGQTGASASFERPNRLKAREEGGIKWVELLEKFRNVQEKARRAQRVTNLDDDGPAGQILPERARLKPVEAPTKHVQAPAAANAAGKLAAPAQGHVRARSGLSNLGRFAGGVGSRKTKR